MLITRTWAMPNKWTFKIPPIMNLLIKYANNGQNWADPFAGQSTFAEYRNDLNPNNAQKYCVEAATFMKAFPAGSLNGVIFDPPYSLTQVSRSYEEMGYKFKGKEDPTGGFTSTRDAVCRAVCKGGHVISFGWNTVGMGKNRGAEIIEILIVSHGGNRNDTLCTVESL
jgi:hypothetical protein